MQTLRILSGLTTASLLCAAAQAQNDECAGALPIATGMTPFDTTAATTSFAWPCALGGADLWYRYTSTGHFTVTVNTCATTLFDTAIEVFSGTCASLVSIQCNDDHCGLQSEVEWVTPAARIDYYIRVGGYNSETGPGALRLVESPPPPPGCENDELAFLATCTRVDGEDFEGFTADMPFDVPGGLPLGTSMNIEAFNPLTVRNFVDTPPFQHTDNNGTNHASCLTDRDATPTEILIDLGRPAGGFGCQVSQALDNELAEMAIFDGAVLQAVCSVASNDIDQFVGYTLDCDMILWRSATLMIAGGEGFGMDGLVVCARGPIGQTTNDCPQLPSSIGTLPTVALFGTGDAGDDVEASVALGPPGQFGYFLSGSGPTVITSGCGSVCIGATVYRYNSAVTGHVYQFDGAGNAGPVALQTDGSFPPVPPVMVGETRRFQGWYRDAGCPAPSQAFNFTDVVALTFQ